MELRNYIEQINNKVEYELLNLRKTTKYLYNIIERTPWMPIQFKEHLKVVNKTLLEIFDTVKLIKVDNSSRVKSLRLANLLNAYLHYISQENNFFIQTAEDIALAQIWFETNARDESLSSKTFEFFLSKNQFTEGVAVENSYKLSCLIRELIS